MSGSLSVIADPEPVFADRVHDFKFYQGDDERRVIIWENPPGTPAVDLTGAAIRMQIRNKPADAEDSVVIAEVSVGDGVTIINGPAAQFEVLFDRTKTTLLLAEQYCYDLEVTPLGGDRKTVLNGRILVGKEKTR